MEIFNRKKNWRGDSTHACSRDTKGNDACQEGKQQNYEQKGSVYFKAENQQKRLTTIRVLYIISMVFCLIGNFGILIRKRTYYKILFYRNNQVHHLENNTYQEKLHLHRAP